MGYRHSRDEILDAAIAVAARDGLSQLTYGRVAAHLGINDRMVVYYFATKDELVGDVLAALGTTLQGALAPAFAAPKADHLAIVEAAWPMLANAEADPTFAMFFEAIGLAVAGRDPYRALVPQLLAGWVEWVATLLDGPLPRRRGEAAAAVALIDGLLLMRQLAGPEAAAAALRAAVGTNRRR